MNYTSVVGSNNHGRHVIASSTPSQIVNHPVSGNYTNEEMSTFIYSPGFSYNPNVDVRSTFIVRGMENCYCDYVYVHSFRRDEPRWIFEAR